MTSTRSAPTVSHARVGALPSALVGALVAVLAGAALMLARPAAAQPAHSPPWRLELEWPERSGDEGAEGSGRPLALFESDRDDPLACRDSRAPTQPVEPGRHRCLFPATGVLDLGEGRRLWTATVPRYGEHDGMSAVVPLSS
jgi:hypothetical protein